MIFNDNEELIIASGYYLNGPTWNYRQENYADVWKTAFTFSDTEGLRGLCRNQTIEEIQEIEARLQLHSE